MMKRRDFAAALAAAAGLAAAALLAPRIVRADAPRILRITARKFEFAPREIALARGEPVLLELESLDRLHGFDAPSLGLQGEFVPGRITRLAFTPDSAGRFTFTCNVFCGDGHEEMDGLIVVT
jgi:cytochrome c oxidase subunit 2